MKLINMTDFVLKETNSTTTLSESFEKCVTYAKFLKQPLKLEMFVPCDENSKMLNEPSCMYIYKTQCFECTADEMYRCRKYLEAKEKVLFKGIDLDTAKYHCNRNVRTIEYFTSFNVELKPNAIKQ
jgi:hypothetical protein